MKTSLLLLFALSTAFSNIALANEQLAKAKNCMVCHAVDKKMVGPAYKDVAAKYAGQKSAEDKLAQKIIKGSVGEWGQVPMPPNNVTEKEARTLVQWILSQKQK
jgi:cytochrome c